MKTIILTALITSMFSVSTYAIEDQPAFEIKLNTRYFGDEGTAHASVINPSPQKTQYEQSALGIELNYQSPYWNNIIGLDASVYGVTRLFSSGNNTVQLFDVKPDGELDRNFATIGVLALKVKPNNESEIKIGLQPVNTLFVKTTTNRAIPDTFSGISATWKPMPELKTYLGYYDHWRPRTASKYDNFVTDQNEKIDYIGIIGSEYQWKDVTFNAEYLNSKDYLRKYGLQASYPVKLDIGQAIFRTGAFFSEDAGNLFVCGVEADLDCNKGQRIDHDGSGYFVEGTWKYNKIELGAALSKFDGMWIEDNYSTHSARSNILIQDNGTSPFPTSSTIGPDFTSNDELVWMARAKYDWKDYIAGLSTEFKYISGDGAKQSNLEQNITGKERYSEWALAYKVPFVKSLDLRYSYLTYHSNFERSNLSEKINGLLRNEWHQHRVSLTYSYKF